MNKFVSWVLNISAGVFFFLFFLFLFFPLADVAHHYINEVEKLTKGQYRLVAGELNPSLFFKSSVKNLEIYSKAESGDMVLMAKFPEVKIGVSYLPLLAGTVHASFVATVPGGKLEGTLSLGKTSQSINAKIKDVDLSQLPAIAQMIKVPLTGIASGKVEIDYDVEDVLKSEGQIDLSLVAPKIPQTKLSPIPDWELDLPESFLSQEVPAKIKMTLKNGKIDFQNFSFSGPDLSLTLNGHIQINKKSNFSKLNLNGTFGFSDKIKEALPYLVMIENQKNEQGTYPITVSGRLTKPQVQIGTFDLTSLTGAVPAAK